MSNLADRVATEHGRGMIASSEHGAFTVFHCQGCGEEAATAAHHVARKTEAAVREQVAREIDAIAAELRNTAIRKMDQTYEFGAEGLDIAARIARGGAA